MIESAAHLLRVLARCDVENLSVQRVSVLRRLRQVETRAAELGVSDLYGEVVRNPVTRRLQSSYGET